MTTPDYELGNIVIEANRETKKVNEKEVYTCKICDISSYECDWIKDTNTGLCYQCYEAYEIGEQKGREDVIREIDDCINNMPIGAFYSDTFLEVYNKIKEGQK